LNSLPTIKSNIPGKASKVFAASFPAKKRNYRVVHRVAGLGSLGRQRFVALVDWNGARVAREAKALIPSACVWLGGWKNVRDHYEEIVKLAVRCPDPFLEVRKGWIVRRLAPDCSRVELAMLPKGHDEHKLLEAMGRETANIHLGNKHAVQKIKRDLKKRADSW